jgi:hypothetical protein
MTTRQEVYEAINTEREYQDRLWEQSPSRPTSIGEAVLLLEEYVSRARLEWTGEPAPEERTLNVIRKIAGIAVRCMEQHGAPGRVLEILEAPDV